jgi:hypothetical protein
VSKLLLEKSVKATVYIIFILLHVVYYSQEIIMTGKRRTLQTYLESELLASRAEDKIIHHHHAGF